MSTFRQLTINKLNFPYELKDIIKSYCFYDTNTAILIIFIKMIKKQIVKQINEALYSRKNGRLDYDNADEYSYNDDRNIDFDDTIIRININDNNGHWCFNVDENEIQFRAVNCIVCGNYIYSSVLHNNISCSCIN